MDTTWHEWVAIFPGKMSHQRYECICSWCWKASGEPSNRYVTSWIQDHRSSRYFNISREYYQCLMSLLSDIADQNGTYGNSASTRGSRRVTETSAPRRVVLRSQQSRSLWDLYAWQVSGRTNAIDGIRFSDLSARQRTAGSPRVIKVDSQKERNLYAYRGIVYSWFLSSPGFGGLADAFSK